MSDWKIFFECSNGHRFGVEMQCPDCNEVIAEHLHGETRPPDRPIRLSWWGWWRARRRLKDADTWDWGNGNDTSHHGY